MQDNYMMSHIQTLHSDKTLQTNHIALCLLFHNCYLSFTYYKQLLGIV